MTTTSMNINYAPVRNGEVVYFRFEEDFVEDNIRCIPMIVRFKLDACGIKLKLKEWGRFSVRDRKYLAEQSCVTQQEIKTYRLRLEAMIRQATGQAPTALPIDETPAWDDTEQIIAPLQEQAALFGWTISAQQWNSLNNLQRFALLKLCRPGHENRNFPGAMQEFGWS